nr:MAG TPA: hypothetical protein [Caudoviricetes sp.]
MRACKRLHSRIHHHFFLFLHLIVGAYTCSFSLRFC